MNLTPHTPAPLLSVQNLSVGFPTPAGMACAVNGLSLDLMPGQVFGLVGESGCGKSMTSLAILRLIPTPGKITHGQILFEGQNLLNLSNEGMRRLRGSRIALIPQDPLTSLNPVYTIGDQLREVLTLHLGLSHKAATQRAAELLDQVRLPYAKDRLNDYPHQFSGGMRQRVMIAMALSCNPSLLIADEPTTALDVTIQAQILALLRDLQREHGMSILMITHDLGVVAEVCDRVAVMYAGRMVETADVDVLFSDPQHPYTQGLLASVPKPVDYTHPETVKPRLTPIEGQPPPLTALPRGCAFAPRCAQAFELCLEEPPEVTQLGHDHTARCYAAAAKL